MSAHTPSESPATGDKPSDWVVAPARGHLRRPAIHMLVTIVASLLTTLLMVLGVLFAPSEARAAEGAVIGLHVGTLHMPARPTDHNLNPGLYLKTESGLTLGGYRNSLGRGSVYLAQTWSAGPFSLTLGAVSGYRRRAYDAPCSMQDHGKPEWMLGCKSWDTRVKTWLAPLVAPSVAGPSIAGITPRLTFMPGAGSHKSNGLHLSLERPLH
jgi:hypothetical protein